MTWAFWQSHDYQLYYSFHHNLHPPKKRHPRATTGDLYVTVLQGYLPEKKV